MCHILPLIFVLGIVAMVGEGFLIVLLLCGAIVGIKLIFTTGDKWLTGMFAFMIVITLINVIM